MLCQVGLQLNVGDGCIIFLSRVMFLWSILGLTWWPSGVGASKTGALKTGNEKSNVTPLPSSLETPMWPEDDDGGEGNYEDMWWNEVHRFTHKDLVSKVSLRSLTDLEGFHSVNEHIIGGGIEGLAELSMHDPDSQPTFNLRDESGSNEEYNQAKGFRHTNIDTALKQQENTHHPLRTNLATMSSESLKGTSQRRLQAEESSLLQSLYFPLGMGKAPRPGGDVSQSRASGREDLSRKNTHPPKPHHSELTGGSVSYSGDSGFSDTGSRLLPSRGMKAPHEYYDESRFPPAVKGLRWTPDPRVLDPDILKGLVKEPAGPELVKEKALWQNAYGFNKELTVQSTIRRGSKFQIVFTGVLGSGGIGVVLSAFDVSNKRRIAVKVCRLQKNTQHSPHFAQEILRRRAQEEISLWKYVPAAIGTQHWSQVSQVVIPVDMVEPVERLPTTNEDAVKYSYEWVILDVFAGDLVSIDSIWNGSILTRIEVTKQVIYATMSLHAMGLVHSDIKPPNFLVHHDGRVYVSDSSLSTPINEDTSCLNGTLHYLPPENMRCQIYNKRRIMTSERKDSWAVGVVIFRLFCSTLPFNMKGMWPPDVAMTIGNATAADLDFTGCHPDTPILIMGLIRLLLTPAVTLRPTLRDLYLNHPLFGMSNSAIAAGKKMRDVEHAIRQQHPSYTQYLAHH